MYEIQPVNCLTGESFPSRDVTSLAGAIRLLHKHGRIELKSFQPIQVLSLRR